MLPEWLSHRARISPDRTAIVAGTEQLTFAQLDERVSSVCGYLQTRSINPGDRVAVLCRNGLPFAELAHAIPRLGAILVPLNTRRTSSELARQLADVDARALLHHEQHVEFFSRAGNGLDLISVAEIDDGAPPFLAPPSVDLERVHSIIFTSGTTGEPKGAILTHGNLWYSAVASALNLGHAANDRWLAVLPLFHVGGLSILLRSVITGITAVIHERFDSAAVNGAIDQEEITIVSVVSTMLDRMLDERRDRPYPPTLRCVLLGGGPAPRQLLERCRALGVPVVQTYGLTETASQAATLAPEEALLRLGSAGKPLVTTTIDIEKDGTLLPPGEVGEIVVCGPTVTPGYFRHPEATERAVRDGRLYTGDIGYLDAAGYLYVLNRRHDLIISGGENIYPGQVEAVVAAHPAVAEVAVFGVADERWGQLVVAAVVLHGGHAVAEDELLAFCRARLAGYEVPRYIVWRESLPRSTEGKLLRHELRQALERQMPMPE